MCFEICVKNLVVIKVSKPLCDDKPLVMSSQSLYL